MPRLSIPGQGNDGGQRVGIDKDFAHIVRHADKFGVELTNVSDDMGLLALQGPKAAAILQPLTDVDLSAIKYYHFAEGKVWACR